MERDEQEIRDVIAEWHRRSARGELEAVLDLMTDDATFLRSGAPPMSRAEFADGFRQWSGQVHIDSTSEIKDVHASGDVGYAWSFLKVAMTRAVTGQTTRREGHVLSVFRKAPDGRWRLARDANLLPPMPQG